MEGANSQLSAELAAGADIEPPEPAGGGRPRSGGTQRIE